MQNRLVLGLALLLWVLNAFALKSDAQQEVHIDAGHATFDQKNKVTVFTGQIVITQGSLVVHAEKGTASEDKDGNQTIELYGTPVTFVQLNDDGDRTEGQGNNFQYTTHDNLAILSGRARVKKGNNLVMGDKLTYNTQTQIFSATSTNANGVTNTKRGRVTVILQPNKKAQNGSESIFKFQ